MAKCLPTNPSPNSIFHRMSELEVICQRWFCEDSCGIKILIPPDHWKITFIHNLCYAWLGNLRGLVNMGATCDTGEKSLLLNQHFFDNRAIFALIGREQWSIIVKAMEMTRWWHNLFFPAFSLSRGFFNKLQRKWTSIKSIDPAKY